MQPDNFESLVYTPECSWHSWGPRVFFSSGLLCRGEPFKAFVSFDSPFEYGRYSYGPLLLQILGVDGEMVYEKEIASGAPSFSWSSSITFSLDTTENLRAGSYVALVSSPWPRGWPDVEVMERRVSLGPMIGLTGLERRVGGRLMLGVYEFHVLEREDYLAHWTEMFGETWGEPVYWDSLGEGRAEELVAGLPVGGLLDALPEDFEINARSLGGLVGPVALALAANEGVGLPCVAEFPFFWETSRPPHIDLTKLFWLLNALAPAVLNAALFSRRLYPRTRVYEWGMTLDMDFDFYRYAEGESAESPEGLERLAPLVPLVSRMSDFAEISFEFDREFRLLLK